jgi:predicted nucleic-acid-binding protein
MRAVDTNIIVRFLVADDPAQAQKACNLFGQEPLFVARTVLLEVEWVLRGVYGMPAAEIIPALRALAGVPGVSVENASLVAKAMDWAEAGMDFADALHLAAAGECTGFLTFDRRFRRTERRLGGIPVSAPRTRV